MYQLRYFIPGTLGAVMLYILFRDYYLKLTQKYKWKKSLASIFLIILSAFAIILPIWISFETVVPEMKSIIQNPEVILLKFEQAKQFTAATEVTSLAITKLDGTAKGGVVLGISDAFKIPVKYIGVGERMQDLQSFDKYEFVDSFFHLNS
jgi:predicted PurR-regulated permease PerM